MKILTQSEGRNLDRQQRRSHYTQIHTRTYVYIYMFMYMYVHTLVVSHFPPTSLDMLVQSKDSANLLSSLSLLLIEKLTALKFSRHFNICEVVVTLQNLVNRENIRKRERERERNKIVKEKKEKWSLLNITTKNHTSN